MSNMYKWISKNILKKNWDIWLKSFDSFTQIEVSDPLFLWVNADELLLDVITRIFRDYNYLLVSQYVDKDQWKIDVQENFLRNISEDWSLPAVITRSFESPEPAKVTDTTYTIHVVGHSEKRWLTKVIRFGMTSNPNIIYGSSSRIENWPFDVFELNKRFRKWFELEADESELKEIVNQVDLLGWTEDGHLNIGLGRERDVNELIEIITELAKEKSLIPIIKKKG